MMHQKPLLVGVALLAVGAVAGWSASQIKEHNAAMPDTTAWFDVQEPSAGNITPQEPYRPAPPARVSRPSRAPARSSGIAIPAGSSVHVIVDEALSSRTAQVGQTWTGEVAEPVYSSSGRLLVPSGSRVTGSVVAADPAARGDRARLQLAMSSINVNGRSYRVRGTSAAVVAGSPRTRNLGAIAGATAAGALIGKAVGGSTKSTIIGAAVGAGASTAAVAASKGYQATIPAGKEIVFTTNSSVAVRA